MIVFPTSLTPGALPMATADLPHATIIRPVRRAAWTLLAELWAYRQLLSSLVRRQVRLDYRELSLGLFWALARPVTMLAIFTLFKRYSAARTGVEVPYPVYLYSGLIFWFFFTDATTGAASAIQRDVGLMRKIYFPRLVSPLVSLFAQLVPLAVAGLPLVVLMVYFETLPGWRLLLLPLVLGQCALLILGVGLLVSALSLKSKDWQRLLALCLYVGLFLSPVIYAPAMLPETVQPLLQVNPMSGTLMAIRACLMEAVAFPLMPWLYALAVSIATLAIGMLAFQRAENDFVDRL